MIQSFSCINVFSTNVRLMKEFYHEKLNVPVVNTIVDELDGVNLGFLENAPTICLWDANKWNTLVSGTMSFVFMCDDLDKTCDTLRTKGLTFEPPVKFEWGTYELRLKDPDGNEVVIVENIDK